MITRLTACLSYCFSFFSLPVQYSVLEARGTNVLWCVCGNNDIWYLKTACLNTLLATLQPFLWPTANSITIFFGSPIVVLWTMKRTPTDRLFKDPQVDVRARVCAPRCLSWLSISNVWKLRSLRGNEKWGLKEHTVWIGSASAGR